MDPGRKKFEERNIEFVAVGDVVVTPAGVKFLVEAVGTKQLHVIRKVGAFFSHSTLDFKDYPTIRCEVERGPTH